MGQKATFCAYMIIPIFFMHTRNLFDFIYLKVVQLHFKKNENNDSLNNKKIHNQEQLL